MPGRSSDPIENVPQFEDFQCPVNQVTHTCQVLRCCPKDFELPVQDESEVLLHNLSVGLLQTQSIGRAPKSWQCADDFSARIRPCPVIGTSCPIAVIERTEFSIPVVQSAKAKYGLVILLSGKTSRLHPRPHFPSAAHRDLKT